MTIRAMVNARLDAMLRVKVRGPAGIETEVATVMGTGFSGSLALPQSLVESLGLQRLMGGTATLADGTPRRYNTYDAEIEWDGEWRGVVVSALGDEALVGMSLLAGQELRVEVVAGGLVEIGPLPWTRAD